MAIVRQNLFTTIAQLVLSGLLFVVILPTATVIMLGWLVLACLVLIGIHLVWFPQGKNMLVVYSNSPHWQRYFETRLLPLLSSQAKVLNYSQRKKWPAIGLRTWVFNFFAGYNEFSPIVIVFKPCQWPKRFRFYQAFRDYKHGKMAKLNQVEEHLADCLNIDFNSSDRQLNSSLNPSSSA